MSLIFPLNGHFIYHLHLNRVVWLLMLRLTCSRMVIFHVFLTALIGWTEFICKLECVEAILAGSSIQAPQKYLHFSTIMWEEDRCPAKVHFSALPVLPYKHRHDGPQLMFTIICYSWPSRYSKHHWMIAIHPLSIARGVEALNLVNKRCFRCYKCQCRM